MLADGVAIVKHMDRATCNLSVHRIPFRVENGGIKKLARENLEGKGKYEKLMM
jgi:hypothetical protein